MASAVGATRLLLRSQSFLSQTSNPIEFVCSTFWTHEFCASVKANTPKAKPNLKVTGNLIRKVPPRETRFPSPKRCTRTYIPALKGRHRSALSPSLRRDRINLRQRPGRRTFDWAVSPCWNGQPYPGFRQVHSERTKPKVLTPLRT